MEEYLFLILIVVVTFGVYKAKELYFGNSTDIYNKMMVGLVLWALLLLMRAIDHNTTVVLTVAADHAVYWYLVQALLLVSGGVFVTVSIIQWVKEMLTISDELPELKQHISFLTNIAKISDQLFANVETEDLLRTLLLQYTKAESIEIFSDLHSYPVENEYMTEAAAGELSGRSETTDGRRSPSSVTFIPSEISRNQRSTAIITLATSRRRSTNVVIMWGLHAQPSKEKLETLELFAQLVNSAALASAADEERVKEARLERISRLSRDAEKIQVVAQQLHSELRELSECDILRIAIYDSRGFNVTQYCVGNGRNLLNERNKSISTQKTLLGDLYKLPRYVQNNRLSDSPYEDDRWLCSCGATAAITLPICCDGRLLAAVTLASENRLQFEYLTEELLVDLAKALLPLIKTDISAHQLMDYNRQFLNLADSVQLLMTDKGAPDKLQALAEMIVHRLPISFCRIWRYESAIDSLVTAVDASIRDFPKSESYANTVKLSETPWHRIAARTGRSVVINQQEAQLSMDEEEIGRTSIRGLQSALLVPLHNENELVGIMTLVELRSWERRSFSLTDSIFVRAIANIAARLLKDLDHREESRRLENRIERMETHRELGDLLTDLPRRMATPLSSILARARQLQTTTVASETEATKNLEIIRKQTEKLINEVRTIQDLRRVGSSPVNS